MALVGTLYNKGVATYEIEKRAEYMNCDSEKIYVENAHLIREWTLNGHKYADKYDIHMIDDMKRSDTKLTFTFDLEGEDSYYRCVFPEYCTESIYEFIMLQKEADL